VVLGRPITRSPDGEGRAAVEPFDCTERAVERQVDMT